MRFPQKAIVLLSGGLDSATALWWAVHKKKWSCRALLFDYGQRHRKELISAKKLATRVSCPTQTVTLRLPWGGSSLLDKTKSLPSKPLNNIGKGKIPSTYVPARNTIFLSYALSWADVVGADHIVIGANALDYSGYPDCRPNYLRAMEKVGNLGTRQGTEKNRPPKIWAPLLRLTKTKIIKMGLELGVPYELTWSCYQGQSTPCGQCDSCQLRAKGFHQSHHADPALL